MNRPDQIAVKGEKMMKGWRVREECHYLRGHVREGLLEEVTFKLKYKI